MAYYSEYHGQASAPMNNLQEQISMLSQNLHEYARQRGIVLEDGPGCYDPYPRGHPYVVPTCHICGFQGHAPADCQRGNSYRPDCFGMSFAQQGSSCQNNYSPGWPEYPNMSYGNNSPPISSFSPSYQMQGSRYGLENQYYPHQCAAPTNTSGFHQEQHQFSAQSSPAEKSTSIAELQKKQQELMEQLNSHLMQLKASSPQTAALEPQHQPQEPAPMELNDPPQVQSSEEGFDATEKLSRLCLKYAWCPENDPFRPAIIKEMKKIKDGRDLVDELRRIEKEMNFSNTISSQVELELSAPEAHLDTSEVPIPSHEPEQTSQSKTQAAAVAEEEAAEIEKEETPQILEEEDSQLVCISEEQVETEDMELEIPEDMHVAIQEAAETGLSNPLDDMLSSDFSTLVSQYPMPLLNVELNHDLFNSDNTYYAIDFAYDRIHVPHNPHAKITLENACFDKVHVSQDYNCFPEYDVLLAAPYHSTHVLYSYTYMIGYSIDDIVGVSPITSANCSLCEYTFRFLLMHHPLRPPLARVDIPWDPGGYKAW